MNFALDQKYWSIKINADQCPRPINTDEYHSGQYNPHLCICPYTCVPIHIECVTSVDANLRNLSECSRLLTASNPFLSISLFISNVFCHKQSDNLHAKAVLVRRYSFQEHKVHFKWTQVERNRLICLQLCVLLYLWEYLTSVNIVLKLPYRCSLSKKHFLSI